jgi:hypothetical protein
MLLLLMLPERPARIQRPFERRGWRQESHRHLHAVLPLPRALRLLSRRLPSKALLPRGCSAGPSSAACAAACGAHQECLHIKNVGLRTKSCGAAGGRRRHDVLDAESDALEGTTGGSELGSNRVTPRSAACAARTAASSSCGTRLYSGSRKAAAATPCCSTCR